MNFGGRQSSATHRAMNWPSNWNTHNNNFTTLRAMHMHDERRNSEYRYGKMHMHIIVEMENVCDTHRVLALSQEITKIII